jgi:hypothetical protein
LLAAAASISGRVITKDTAFLLKQPEHSHGRAFICISTQIIGNLFPADVTAGAGIRRQGWLPPSAWAVGSWVCAIRTAIVHLRDVLGDQTYESLARKGETMTTAAKVTYAYDQIDHARAELEHSG